MVDTCSFGVSIFVPVIIHGFSYSSVLDQLLTVPVHIWVSVVYISVAFAFDYPRRRALSMAPLALITPVGYAIQLGVAMSLPTC
jgi:hypothetical protein